MQQDKPMQGDAHGQSVRYLRLRSRRFPVQSIPVLFLSLKLKHMRQSKYVDVFCLKVCLLKHESPINWQVQTHWRDHIFRCLWFKLCLLKHKSPIKWQVQTHRRDHIFRCLWFKLCLLKHESPIKWQVQTHRRDHIFRCLWFKLCLLKHESPIKWQVQTHRRDHIFRCLWFESVPIETRVSYKMTSANPLKRSYFQVFMV